MKCQNCGTNNPAGEEFCQNCGAQLTPVAATPTKTAASSSSVVVAAGTATATTVTCANCQTVNPAGEEFCQNCGAQLPKPGAGITPNRAAPTAMSQNGSGRGGQAITKCPSCNADVIEGARFCRTCGYNFIGAGLRTSNQLNTVAISSSGNGVSSADNIVVGSLLGENGKYRVNKQIGQGGMGKVFLADDTVLKRQVVIKAMLRSDDPEDAEAAVREREFLAAIKHPNIVSIYDFFVVGTDGFIVMEFVNGKTLYQLMDKQGRPFDAPTAVRYMHDIMPTFVYMHRLGLVYCDFKPQNVMVETLKDGTETVKLIDLGTVIKHEPHPPAVYGTQGFYAPEAVENPSPQTDLYTICRSLAWMVTWFDLNNPQFGMPPMNAYPVFQANSVLYRLLYKGTHPDPARRFQSSEELMNQLDGVLRMVQGGQPGVPVNSTLFATGSLILTSRMGTKAFSALDEKDPAYTNLKSGDEALKRGDVRGAIASYSAAVGQNQKSIDGYLRLAELAIEEGRFNDAFTEIQRAERIDKANWKIAWYKGRLLEAQGNFPMARDQYNALVEDVPGELPPLLALARVEAKLGSVQKALETYNLILRAEPSNNEAIFGASDAFMRLQRVEDAAKVLARVPDTSARFEEAQLTISNIFLDKETPSDDDLRAVAEALRQLKMRGSESADYLLKEAKFYHKLWEMTGKSKANPAILLPYQDPKEQASTHHRRKVGELAEESYQRYIDRNPNMDVQAREQLVREKLKVAPWRLF
jgi:serine/threonine-protein kinase PknG